MKTGHRLADISEFPESAILKLAAFSISTAEEFLSHAIFERSALISATQMNEEDFETAVSACERVLSPESVSEIQHAAEEAAEKPGGALPPTSDDFEIYRQLPEDESN